MRPATGGLLRLMLLAVGLGCADGEPTAPGTRPEPTAATATTGETGASGPTLRYFGYTLVDVGFDDPLDDEARTSYVDEVAPFTNLADLLVVGAEDVTQRLDRMEANGLGAVLHLHALFFEEVGTSAPSGHAFALRADHQEVWSAFVDANDLTGRAHQVGALYLGEEPTWNGVSADDLRTASDLLQQTLPTVPVLIVEAWPAVNQLQVPPSVDWVGFDRYFVRDVTTDPDYQREFAAIHTARSRPDQRLVVVFDAHYLPEWHGAYGLSEDDLADVARHYHELASGDPDVVALLGYHWPGGFLDPRVKGARELPAAQAEHRRIGAEITGKPSTVR